MVLQTKAVDREQIQSCISALQSCVWACEECAVTCLKDSNPVIFRDCIREAISCSDICQLSARFWQRQESHRNRICLICSDICDTCAQECARHETDHCQRCAEACRLCASECQRLPAIGDEAELR